MSQSMSINIGAKIFMKKSFNLERTSLSLIVLGSQKVAIGGDGRAL